MQRGSDLLHGAAGAVTDLSSALPRISGVTRAALVLAALLLGAPSAVARVSGGTPVALVTAETENQLIAVEFPQGKVLRRVTVAADPENVVADQKNGGRGQPWLRRGHAPRCADAAGAEVASRFRRTSPRGAYADGKWAFVTDDPRGQLDVVSLTRLRIVNRLYVGAGAHHLSLSPDGQRLWIALGEHARQISIVDVSRPARPRAATPLRPGLRRARPRLQPQRQPRLGHVGAGQLRPGPELDDGAEALLR